MTHLTRFAATGATFSAISLSVMLNGLYGWNWQPYAFGGIALAITAVIFDIFKAGLFPHIVTSIKDKRLALASFQALVFASLMALSLFTGLSFMTKTIAGKHSQETARTDHKAKLANQITATKAAISTILNNKYSEGCNVKEAKRNDQYGNYMKRWCGSAPDGYQALTTRLSGLTGQHKAAKVGKVTTWGEIAVSGLTGWKAENIRLGVLVLMAIMLEIVSGFGLYLTQGQKKAEKTVKPATEKKAIKPVEPMQTKEQSNAQLMAALYEKGISQGNIAKAFEVSQPTVSRTLAMV